MAEVRAAAPVVTDADPHKAITSGHLDLGDGGACMLGRVGQRLGDRVVGGDLHRLGKPPHHLDVQVNWNCGTAGQRSECRAQPAVGED